MITKVEQKDKLAEFIGFLIDRGYFGELLIKFNYGNVVHMELSKGMKLDAINLGEIHKVFIKQKAVAKEFSISDSLDNKAKEKIKETVK
jgi:hypothetical protein